MLQNESVGTYTPISIGSRHARDVRRDYGKVAGSGMGSSTARLKGPCRCFTDSRSRVNRRRDDVGAPGTRQQPWTSRTRGTQRSSRRPQGLSLVHQETGRYRQEREYISTLSFSRKKNQDNFPIRRSSKNFRFFFLKFQVFFTFF